jgi:multidrug efflux pump subunit AcrB
VIALFMIYALLAIPLRSYLQPFIIMIAIPFGLIGSVVGHLIMGFELSMMSLIGLVALGGVVVNSGLVLVDYINRERRAGMPLVDAVREASVVRFRPILLTSLTTYAGLIPLMLEESMQAQVLVPMGISIAYGVIFSAAISLLMTPCSYLILEDLKRLPARLRGAPAGASPPTPSPPLPGQARAD